MKLFVTYASEDRPTADQLAVRLRTEGHTVFLDRDDLPAGEGYDTRIRAAISDCDLYVFLISPHAVQAGRYTLTELKFARERFPDPRGRVLPVMCEPTPFQDMPAYLAAVTVLQPQGNLVAETLAEVQAIARRAESENPHPEAVGASLAPAAASPGRSWWTTLPGLLTGVAAVIAVATGLLALFLHTKEPVTAPVVQPPAAVQSMPNATPGQAQLPSALVAQNTPFAPRIVLDGPAQASFEKFHPSTYTVLDVETQPRTPAAYGLSIRVRVLNRDKYDMNLWDNGFRLLVDGVPSAPDSNLDEIVSGNAAKEGVVTFQVPGNARDLVLRVVHQQALGEVADIPLRIVSAGTNLDPIKTQTGQSVTTGDVGAGAHAKSAE